MIEFIEALFNPHIPFLRYALITGILASVAFGMMGTYVVVRRISYIAGAIAHCILGGIGVALYLQQVWGVVWFTPLLGAIFSSLLAAILIGTVSLYAQQREDTVIGALWAVGMAIGLIFLAKTPGYTDPMSYLFGNILLISKKDVILVLLLDILIIALNYYLYPVFVAICFDEEYSRLRGIPVELFYILLLCMIALTIVLLVRIVGIVMVIALLTLPPAVAGNLSRNVWQMMMYSMLFCMAFIVFGLGVSYQYDLPSGPVIIVIAGIIYLLALTGMRFYQNRIAQPRSHE
jgi:zinc transport system permease protein